MRSATVLKALLFLVPFLAACATAPVPVAEAPREQAPVPQDLTVRFVHQIVGDFQESLLRRDAEGFMKHVSEGFYRGRAKLRESLDRFLAEPGEKRLNVEITEVDVGDLRITASVVWSLSRTGAGEDLGEPLGGETVLIFLRAETIRLIDFRKGSLFGIEDL